jgi:hypothetical protein
LKGTDPNPEHFFDARVRDQDPKVTCWCERSVVTATWDEIAAGITHSCGTTRCDDLAARHTKEGT